MCPDPIPIDLADAPGARLTWHALVDSLDPACLDQDLVQVELPGGYRVDAGWYPHGNSSGGGAFAVLVVKDGDWTDPVEDVGLADPVAVARTVEQLAAKYAARGG